MNNRWDNYRKNLKDKLQEDADQWMKLQGEEHGEKQRFFLAKMEEYYRWGRQSAFAEKDK